MDNKAKADQGGETKQPASSPAASSSSSRRSPSVIQSADAAELFEQMQASTGVTLVKNTYPQPSSPVEDLLKASGSMLQGLAASKSVPATAPIEQGQEAKSAYAQHKGTATASSSTSRSVSTSSDLDLKNNDNSFHVIASLLLEYLSAKVLPPDAEEQGASAEDGTRKLLLQPSDKAPLEQLLPASARLFFIEAVQHRLGLVPARPTTPLQLLTLQCQAYNLDADDASNPILTVQNLTEAVFIEVLPLDSAMLGSTHDSMTAESLRVDPDGTNLSQLADTVRFPAQAQQAAVSFQQQQATTQQSTDNGGLRVNIPSADRPPQTTAEQPKKSYVAAPPPPVEKRSSDDGSGGTDGGSRAAPTAVTTESLARQQLLAELREASNLMADSVTPETAKFWRDHVLELQARLRALHGEVPNASLAATPSTSNKHPQQLQTTVTPAVRAAKYPTEQQQYVPPNMSAATSSVASKSKDSKTAPPSIVTEDPSSCSAPMVDVVAPADLPGGYPFEAEIEGQRFLAIVPAGGVRQGDTFTCHMRDLDSVAIDIPIGHWKDGLFSCFKYGCCHPVLLNTLFCPLIALAQTATRVNLDFIGRQRENKDGFSNRAMMLTVMFFWLLLNVALFAGYKMKWSHGMELTVADLVSLALVNGAFIGFVVFVTQSMRSSLRERFMIRESCCCYDLEDLCCATWCLPCTISQMARHTANFDDYEAVCCSKSGLPDGVKVKQTPLKQDTSYIV